MARVIGGGRDMSLRFKLLLIALSTLALPFSGWLFVRQMEELLRQGQEQTLIASARALARALGALKTELPPAGAAIYIHQAPGAIAIDGYADDWRDLSAFAQNLGPPSDAQKVTLLLCANHDWLYLFAEVHDATRTRVDARDPRAATSDHLTLTLEHGTLTRRYLLASAAPGRFDALTLTDASDNALPTTLDGGWQEDGSGYRIELRLPRAQMPDKLALSVFDAVAPAVEVAEPLPLLMLSPELSTELGQFAPEGMRARLLSGEGWVVAETGALAGGVATAPASRRRWLESLVYRHLIAPGLTRAEDFSTTLPRLAAPEIWQALSGVAATAWHPSASEAQVVLAAAVPLKSDGEVRGALLLEQAGDALPLLTNRALLSLVGASLLALAVAGGMLFVFASALSLRIRRLAMPPNGRCAPVEKWTRPCRCLTRVTNSAIWHAASRACSTKSAPIPITCALWRASCRTNCRRRWQSSNPRSTTSTIRPCLPTRSPISCARAVAPSAWARLCAR